MLTTRGINGKLQKAINSRMTKSIFLKKHIFEPAEIQGPGFPFDP